MIPNNLFIGVNRIALGMFNISLPFVLNGWLLNGHEDILKGVLKNTGCLKNKYKKTVLVFKVIFAE